MSGPVSPSVGAVPGYVVVDVETTGFSPGRGDRVVEIAMVRVSEDGAVEAEWTTLVNPLRDVGPTRVHGIRASDVVGAPTFRQIAPAVLGELERRTLVAHNAAFDFRFLHAELAAAGHPVDAAHPRLCTMQWSTSFLQAPSRRLADCCAAAGITNARAHSALGDARATAALLAHYIAASRGAVPWQDVLDRCAGGPESSPAPVSSATARR